jgi:FkbM family methyltransferase
VKHQHPLINAFLHVPEWGWKNTLRAWLATSPWVPRWLADYSPIRGYEHRRRLRPGDVVVDAGAYPGDYALFAARRVGPQGRVICFEPGAANRAVLERHIRRSGLQNLTVVPRGLWNQRATLRFRADGLASTAGAEDGGEAIEVAPLDDLLRELGVDRVDVLKMDIEGAEIEAIQGARETLARGVAHVCIASYHVVNGATTSGYLETFLRGLGYTACSEYPKHLTTYAWPSAAGATA